MVILHAQHTRVLDLLLREDGLSRDKLAQATWRWGVNRRNQVIDELVRLEFVAEQTVPSPGKKPSRVYWLTEVGEKVARQAVDDGVVTRRSVAL